MTRCLVLVLLLPQSTSAAEKADAVVEVSAVSKCARYRLKLDTSSQAPSPWNKNVAAVSMTFRMGFSDSGLDDFPAGRPKDVYLENKDPLVSARIKPNFEVAKNKHFGWTDNTFSSVTVHDLELGKPQKKLDALTLAVTLVRVKSWETISFANLGRGSSGYLKCGPFQLVVRGEEKKVNASVASFSEFQAEKKEYERRVPLQFLNHSYGIRHTAIYDAKQRAFFNTGGVSTGGMSGGTFEMPSLLGQANPGEPIVYPLRAEVRLPKEYETENVLFEFTNFPLAELKKDEGLTLR